MNNSKEYFVNVQSIVRQIWGRSDTILFIFAGAAAEFALNKAVDWLYFTGRLPSDPLGRLFTTVSYARKIVFAENETAIDAIETISKIHNGVEQKRGRKIPDWAYRDVLFMLIDYSIRAFEILERKLTMTEKEEVFDVFYRVGNGMGLAGLPHHYNDWQKMRREHLIQNLEFSNLSKDLFIQYRKHLGLIRFQTLIETQRLLVPQEVKNLLNFKRRSVLHPLIKVYKFSIIIKMDGLLKALLIPPAYRKEIKALDTG